MVPDSDVLTGFPPVVATAPRVLILGSMPGDASLGAQQYYAHPRNAFWPIMQQLFGIDASLSYDERIDGLKSGRVALWDVVHQCRRPGSLDSSIQGGSVVVNDIAGLLAQYPGIVAVFCNGGTAWQLLQRHFLSQRSAMRINIPVHRLPSTSPANARMTLRQKCVEWQCIKDATLA